MKKKSAKPLTIAAAVYALYGTALGQTAPSPAQTTRTAPAMPVATQPPTNVGQIMQGTGGSLMQASLATQSDPTVAKLENVSFIAVAPPVPRMLKKHDLITIIIREESEFSSEGATDTKKETSFDARAEEWIRLNLKNVAIGGGGIGDLPPSIKFSGNRDFKGEGSVDRSDSLIARITAEILDVKPNGTLVVQARKKIRTDDEEQKFILTGICRAEDVRADNTILSTQLFDLDVQKNHKGAVRDSTKRGWVPKLLDFVNPF